MVSGQGPRHRSQWLGLVRPASQSIRPGLLPDAYNLVFSQHAVAGEASRSMLFDFHGAGIILPQSKDYYPKAEFLKWHEGQVFKKPG